MDFNNKYSNGKYIKETLNMFFLLFVLWLKLHIAEDLSQMSYRGNLRWKLFFSNVKLILLALGHNTSWDFLSCDARWSNGTLIVSKALRTQVE